MAKNLQVSKLKACIACVVVVLVSFSCGQVKWSKNSHINAELWFCFDKNANFRKLNLF